MALLLFTLYFFEVGNFKKFALFLSLSLLAKETIALPLASFSLYALVSRRGLKWVAVPVLVSVSYVLVAWKVLLPIWGKVDSLMYSNTWYFAAYGNSPAEVLKYFLTHPTTTIDNMLAHFSRHRSIQSLMGLRFYGRDPNEVFDYDYIVFDRNFALMVDKQAQTQFFGLISHMPEYRLVFARDNVFVYQRVGTPARHLQWGPFIPATPNATP